MSGQGDLIILKLTIGYVDPTNSGEDGPDRHQALLFPRASQETLLGGGVSKKQQNKLLGLHNHA